MLGNSRVYKQIAKKTPANSSDNWRFQNKTVSGSELHEHPLRGDARFEKPDFVTENPNSGTRSSG
jgi:hypothetical protein